MTTTPRQEFLTGAKDTLPLIAGAIPFGIIFGAVAVTGGLSPAATLAMSVFVFAGSSQFIAAGLLTQGIGIGFIIFTTFIVNLRHALYAASLAPSIKKLPQRWLIPLGFWLTDETYAITVTRYAKSPSPHQHWYQLGSSVAMYSNWSLCTLIGIIAGTQLEGMADWGLDFAMVVTFIGIVVPFLTTRPMLACALTAGLVSVATYDFPNKLGLMVGSLAGIIVGVALEYRMTAHTHLADETATAPESSPEIQRESSESTLVYANPVTQE